MNLSHRFSHPLVLALSIMGLSIGEVDTNANPLVSDPAFPLIQLPADYETRRSTWQGRLPPGESKVILDATGPGAVRHFWITSNAVEDYDIEILCDGVDAPQIKMTLSQYGSFGR